MLETTPAGQNIPSNFVGVYRGTINASIRGLGLSESGSFPITVTVMEDGTVRFDGDDPDETFTTGISDAGNFSGSLQQSEDSCSGNLNGIGQVDGTNATGTVECEQGLIKIEAQLDGDFLATK